MSTVRVGVVRGGTNIPHYRKSISDGAILLRALREHDQYTPSDILIDKNEVWHLDGVPILPAQLMHKIDVCVSTVEKPLKKEGHVEHIIRALGIKLLHTPKSALRGYIPESLKDKIRSIGVRVPRHMEIGQASNSTLKEIHLKFSPPYPMHFVNVDGVMQHIFHATTLEDVNDVFTNHTKPEIGNYLIEEFVPGEKWAMTVIPNFRGIRHYTTHPIYMGFVNQPFRSNIPVSNSATHEFADPNLKNNLDLYSRLVSSVLETSHPKTFVFHVESNKKPVLMRIVDRHLVHDDPTLLDSLANSGIKESDLLHLLIQRQ